MTGQLSETVRRKSVRGSGGSAVVGVAASTGGPQALAELLGGLVDLPAPVLLIQHIHRDFLVDFVAWMARVCPLPVALAEQGEPALPGVVYVGPSGVHLKLGRRRRIVLDDSPDRLHRPSADELFASLAIHAGPSGVGVLLTGMGDDGARGLLALHDRGGRTIIQDEESSAVYGMPAAAAKLRAAQQILPLGLIAPAIARAVARLGP